MTGFSSGGRSRQEKSSGEPRMTGEDSTWRVERSTSPSPERGTWIRFTGGPSEKVPRSSSDRWMLCTQAFEREGPTTRRTRASRWILRDLGWPSSVTRGYWCDLSRIGTSRPSKSVGTLRRWSRLRSTRTAQGRRDRRIGGDSGLVHNRSADSPLRSIQADEVYLIQFDPSGRWLIGHDVVGGVPTVRLWDWPRLEVSSH